MQAETTNWNVNDANNYEWNNNERKWAIWKQKKLTSRQKKTLIEMTQNSNNTLETP